MPLLDKILIDQGFAEAKVYNSNKGFYFIKVSLPDIGLYIKGIRAKKSKHENGDIWIQMPSYKVGRNWIEPFECSEQGKFKSLIRELSRAAIFEYDNINFDTGPNYVQEDNHFMPTSDDLEELNEMDKSRQSI